MVSTAGILTPAESEALLNGPAMQPPPGVVSNFIDPPNFKEDMVVEEIILLTLSTIAISIRLYTKLRINRQENLEDFLCFIAWALFVVLFGIVRSPAPPAHGRHQWDVQYKDMRDFLYHVFICSFLYGAIICFVRASILFQYVRIFSPGKKGIFYWSCHCLIGLNFMFYSACLFLEIFSCQPVSKNWDLLIEPSCTNISNRNNIAAASINVLSDFVTILLPQPIIWKLHMDFKRKLGVSLIFATALLACICAAVRLYYVVILTQSLDATWWVSKMTMYMFPELALGIIISCLPTIPKFFTTVAGAPFFSRIGTLLYSLVSCSTDGTVDKRSREISNLSPNQPIFYYSHDRRRSSGFSRLLAANKEQYHGCQAFDMKNTMPEIKELQPAKVCGTFQPMQARTESQLDRDRSSIIWGENAV